jgi:hypothetical protein
MENTWWERLIAVLLTVGVALLACGFVVVWCWWFFDLPLWAGVAVFLVLSALASKAT